jgi:hypothetical protein
MFALGLIVGLVVGVVATNIAGAVWLGLCQAAGEDGVGRMETHPKIINLDDV